MATENTEGTDPRIEKIIYREPTRTDANRLEARVSRSISGPSAWVGVGSRLNLPASRTLRRSGRHNPSLSSFPLPSPFTGKGDRAPQRAWWKGRD